MPGDRHLKVGLVLTHKSQLKIYMPFIDNGLNVQLYLLHMNAQEDIELKEKLKSNEVGYISFQELSDLNEFLDKEEIKYIFTENIKIVQLKYNNPELSVCYLQHSHDIVSYLPKMIPITILSMVDKYFLFSDS